MCFYGKRNYNIVNVLQIKPLNLSAVSALKCFKIHWETSTVVQFSMSVTSGASDTSIFQKICL